MCVKGNNMKKTLVTISNELEMAGFIKANGTQCRFVSMTSETPVTKIKVGSPYAGVLKVSQKRGMVNVNYVDSVRRKVSAQFDVPMSAVEYVAGETWYKHVMTDDGKPLPLVEHKEKNDGQYYLQYFPTSSKNAYQMPDGTPVSEEALKPYLYKESKRVEFKPTVIVVKLGNIKQLRASGVIMSTEDFDEAQLALDSVENVTVDIGQGTPIVKELVPA